MDRLLVSTFRSAKDNKPTTHETDWDGLRAMVSEHRIMPHDAKLDAPALCPAEWPEGANRSKKGVQRVWFGALDYDKLTQAEMDQVLDAVDGLTAILYTTWSHPERYAKDGTWSFRLLIALTRPVEASEWKKFWPRFHARTGSLADDRCKDPSRMYFTPSAASAEGCIVEHFTGHALDVDVVLGMEAPSSNTKEKRIIGRADLDDLAARLVRRRSNTAKWAASIIREALAGNVLSAPGSRDEAMFNAACFIAEEWPQADAASVAGHFAKSIEAMAALSPHDCPTVQDMAEKISRKQGEVHAAEQERDRERKSALASRIRAAFGGERDEPYTEDELDSFAKAAGCTRADFRRRWIIQAGSSYYIFKDGSYGTSVTDRELQLAADCDLAPASTAGVDVWKTTEKGDLRQKTVQELASQYGEHAKHVVVDLNAQRSYFRASDRTLIEAPCPRRNLDPCEPADVAEWLHVLGGTEINRLLDWLAVLPDLDEPVAAIYLDGAPGSGKTLFADALSRIWTTNGPTPLSEVVGSFNEHLLNCPLVLADEVLPDILKRSEGTGDLRQLIQARQLVLRRKYRPTATIKGSVRVVLASNNRHLLDTQETLTPEDIAAVAERVLYIHADAKAAELLKNMGRQRVAKFVTEDLVARYALWLRQHRKVNREHRFLVSGTDSALHRSLTTGRGLASAICHWCIGYLLQPGKLDGDGRLLVRVYEGELLVTARALSESWEQYSTNVKAPPSGKISRVLSGLSRPKRQLVAGDGKPTNYWPIKTENLLTWADEMGYATEQQIREALAIETVIEGPAKPNKEK